MVDLISEGYKIPKASQFVFVCGGVKNAEDEIDPVRYRFRDYCTQEEVKYHILHPEDAMDAIQAEHIETPFDIADFEELIGEISHAVVIFPEAAGSFAETGYFSAVDKITKRCLLVLNQQFQGRSSFISLGPAKKIEKQSLFGSNLNLDYKTPNFKPVIEKLDQIAPYKTKKVFSLKKYNKTSKFEVYALIQELIQILRCATLSDIKYFLNKIYKGSFSNPDVSQLFSIMHGAKHIINVSDYGQYTCNLKFPSILEPRDGYRATMNELRLEVTQLLSASDPEFLNILERIEDANP